MPCVVVEGVVVVFVGVGVGDVVVVIVVVAATDLNNDVNLYINTSVILLSLFEMVILLLADMSKDTICYTLELIAIIYWQ